MRAASLAFIVLLLIACDDDSSPRAGDGASDAGTAADASADASELPPIESRREPACEPLGRVASADVGPLSLETDFFKSCTGNYELPIADRAFTWKSELMLLRGDCVLPSEAEPICVAPQLEADGNIGSFQHVIAVDEGEVITVVVNADDEYAHNTVTRRQALTLHIEPAALSDAADAR